MKQPHQQTSQANQQSKTNKRTTKGSNNNKTVKTEINKQAKKTQTDWQRGKPNTYDRSGEQDKERSISFGSFNIVISRITLDEGRTMNHHRLNHYDLVATIRAPFLMGVTGVTPSNIDQWNQVNHH